MSRISVGPLHPDSARQAFRGLGKAQWFRVASEALGESVMVLARFGRDSAGSVQFDGLVILGNRGTAVTSQTLRDIPLGRVLTLATSSSTPLTDVVELTARPRPAAITPTPRLGRTPHGVDEVRSAVSAYTEALRDRKVGQTPTQVALQALFNEGEDLSERQFRRRLQRARELGLLPASTRGPKRRKS